VPASDIDVTNLLEDEEVIYHDHRLRTIEQIEQSDEIFLLPNLLRAMILGEVLTQPIILSD